MENTFFVDSEYLSPEVLKKKHQLETDPASRKDPMEYLPGMEVIDSDVRDRVLAEMNAYDPARYTARHVRAALNHPTCSLEDFKALLSPAAAPLPGGDGPAGPCGNPEALRQHRLPLHPLYIANYCENYCVYCGFNCYNHIKRKKLTMEQVEHEMAVIAQSGMEEILILTGESRPRATWPTSARPASWPGSISAWWA